MARTHIIVVGAGYAGRSLINRLAARRVDADVTLVDPSSVLSERVRWHERLVGGARDARPLADVLPRGTRHVVARAVDVDLASRTLTTDSGLKLGYDHLASTMGSHTRQDLPPGVGDLTARLEDGALAGGVRSVAVVGGGLTGIEVAAELAQSRPDLTVHLISAGFGGGLSPGAQAYARAALERMGVLSREDARVAGARGRVLEIEGGEPVKVDAVIWCAGVSPAPFPTGAKLALDGVGRIEVDAHLRVPGHEGLWCAGDQARLDMASGEPLRAACAIAMPMGTHLGDNIASAVRGAPTAPFSMHTSMLCVSLGRRDGIAQHLGEHDVATERFWTGRRAAWIKERIVRATSWLPRAEGRMRVPLYRWPSAPLSAAPLLSTAEFDR